MRLVEMINDLTKGAPLKLMLLFSIPLLIGNIFQQFYNIADIIIVGRTLGMTALAHLYSFLLCLLLSV